MLWPGPRRRQAPRPLTRMPRCWRRWLPCRPTGPGATSRIGRSGSRIPPTCTSSTCVSAAGGACTSVMATTGCSWRTPRSTGCSAPSSDRSSTALPIASGVPRAGGTTPMRAASNSAASTPSPSPSASTPPLPATHERTARRRHHRAGSRTATSKHIANGPQPPTDQPRATSKHTANGPQPPTDQQPATGHSRAEAETAHRPRGRMATAHRVRCRRATRSWSSPPPTWCQARTRRDGARSPASDRSRRANWSAWRATPNCSACCSPATASRCGTAVASAPQLTPSVAAWSPATAAACSAPPSRPGARLTTSSPGPNPPKAPQTSTIWPFSATPATTGCTTTNTSSPVVQTAPGVQRSTPATPGCTTTNASSPLVQTAPGAQRSTPATPLEAIERQSVRAPVATSRGIAGRRATRPRTVCRSISRLGARHHTSGRCVLRPTRFILRPTPSILRPTRTTGSPPPRWPRRWRPQQPALST